MVPSTSQGPPPTPALVLRIDLEGFKPPVWRRVVVPTALTFEDLHRVLQVVFEWDGVHLHGFEVHDQRVGVPDPVSPLAPLGTPVWDESMIPLGEMVRDEGEWFRYTYDFGDDWSHTVRVEAVLDDVEDLRALAGSRRCSTASPPASWSDLPACIKGRRAAPLEDSRFAPAPAARFPGSDPEAFEVDEVDDGLDGLRRAWVQRMEPVEPDDDDPAADGAEPPGPTARGPGDLVWLDSPADACLRCGTALEDGGLAVDVILEEDGNFRRWVPGTSCPDCRLRHVEFTPVARALFDRRCDVEEVTGFAVHGEPVPAFVGCGQGCVDLTATRWVGSRPTSLVLPVPTDEAGMSWDAFRSVLAARRTDPPDAGDLEELPREGTWEVGIRPVDWLPPDLMGEARLVHAFVVLDDTGAVRAQRVVEGMPDAKAACSLLVRACVSPAAPVPPRRPRTLVMDEALEVRIGAFEELADAVEAEVETGATPRVGKAVDALLPPATPLGRWVAAQDADELAAFWRARQTVDGAKPWTVMDRPPLVKVRMDGGRAAFAGFAGGEATGWPLAVFASREEVDAFRARLAEVMDAVHAGTEPETPRPEDGLEVVQDFPVTEIPPAAAQRLRESGTLDPDDGGVPLPARLRPDRVDPPRFDLAWYRRLFEALTRFPKAVERSRRATAGSDPVAFEVDGVEVELSPFDTRGGDAR